jgi:hypothetical protein
LLAEVARSSVRLVTSEMVLTEFLDDLVQGVLERARHDLIRVRQRDQLVLL